MGDDRPVARNAMAPGALQPRYPHCDGTHGHVPGLR